MTHASETTEHAKYVAMTNRFHRDARVRAASKQYRADLKAGMAERDAWAKANAVYTAVRSELSLDTDTRTC